MARTVLGIGSSHSPMASSPHELWDAHARGFDMTSKDLLGKDGRRYDYPTLLAKAHPNLAQLSDPRLFPERFDRCQRAITQLADMFEQVSPDLAIIVGEDQHEQFRDDLMPALTVYWGDMIENKPREVNERTPPSFTAARWAFGLEEKSYPVASDLGRHIVEHLVENEFDVAHCRKLPRPQGVGHAFSFVYRRIMNGNVIPHVPVMVNTYYPPNQFTPGRAYKLGRALRKAVDAWAPPDAKVAFIASGGLSHFVVNEELDRAVLAAMRAHDGEAMRNTPRSQMHSGSSEILNWIVVAAAMDGLDMDFIDYVPCYRSPAGTGIGMAFAAWR